MSRAAAGQGSGQPIQVSYITPVEEALSTLIPLIDQKIAKSEKPISSRWIALRLLDADESLREPLSEYLGFDLTQDAEIQACQPEWLV